MTRLLALCVLLALTLSTIVGAPVKKVEVLIGEPREIAIPINAKVSGPVDMPLPNWIVKEGDKLRMIASPGADKSNIVVVGDMTLDVVVSENEPTGCLPYDEYADSIVDGSPMDQWSTVAELLAARTEFNMDDIRVLPYGYAYTYRKLANQAEVKGDSVIIVKSKCGTSVSPAFEWMFENLNHFALTQGSIVSRSPRKDDDNSILSPLSESSTDEPTGEELEMKKETTTLATTTTTRHTRSTTPVALVHIKRIECKQGSYCERELESKTFLGGDGGVHTFNLTIESISENGGAVRPWVIEKGEKRIIGVIPLAPGVHTYRLMGEDKKGKRVSAPFSIDVTEETKKNHQFKMTMHTLPEEPEHLRTTIVKLAAFLKRKSDEIRVLEVSRPSVGKPFISYWNSSIPTTSCPTKEISQWLRVLHHKHGEEVNNDFAKAFDNKPTIHPMRLEVQWMGACESAAAAADSGMKGGTAGAAGRKKEGEEPIAEETEGSLSTLLIVVGLLAILLAVLIAIVCCLACRKQKTHKGTPNDYMSKGTPVVFPDEVDDEHADIPASAPMLVKEERPPLRVSEHSNPLYKPPPPLLSTSSPRPTPAPSAHKLPPPYVPP